jgi:drug/metabolite transporter (DMT)-like permease
VKITNNTKGLLCAVAAGFLWGVLAIVIKVTLNYASPKTIAWSRFFVASVSLVLYASLFDRKVLGIIKNPPWLVFVSAVCIGLNYVFFNTGINVTTPNNAAIFIQTGPLLLALVGIVFYKEKVTKLQMMGFAVAIAGFVMFYREQFQTLFSEQAVYNKGVLLIILAGAMWTCFSVIQKELVKKHSPTALNLMNFSIPAIFLFFTIDVKDLTGIGTTGVLLLLVLGLNTMLAYGCLALALKYTEANKISVILTANPVLTFLSMAILTNMQVSWIDGEVFTPNTLAGAALVILGATLVSVFSGRKNTKDKKAKGQSPQTASPSERR